MRCSGTSDDYAYDANGNMISDLNKGITEIIYNHLNLPTEISWMASSNKIRFVYNAAGQKVKKTVVDGTTTKIVDYLDGFQTEARGSPLPHDYIVWKKIYMPCYRTSEASGFRLV